MLKFLAFILLCTAFFLPAQRALAKEKIKVGEILPQLTLKGKEGGVVDGTPFDSNSLRGQTTIILHIDPDKRDDNEKLQQALKKEDFGEALKSVALINMAATWLPNFAIAEKMAEKQKEFARTPQVKDLDRKAINIWRVKDDSYNVILVDKNLMILFFKEGKLEDLEINQVIRLIKDQATKKS